MQRYLTKRHLGSPSGTNHDGQPTTTTSSSSNKKSKTPRLKVYKIWPSSLTRAGHTTVSVDDPREPLYQFLVSDKDDNNDDKTKEPTSARGMHMGRMATQVPCLLTTPSAKFRHGAERWWCPVHQGQYGKKAQLAETARTGVRCCDQAHDAVDFVQQSDIPVFCLTTADDVQKSADNYGELGIWIGLPPALDTSSTKHRYFPGIHVHARKHVKGKKVVDTNFPAVIVRDTTGRFPLLGGEDGVTITPAAALEYLYYMEDKCPVNQQLGEKTLLPRSKVELVGQVRCKHCSALHEDVGSYFGQEPHKKHLCGQCGRAIMTKGDISNPMMAFHRPFHRRVVGTSPADAELAVLKVSSDDYDLMMWPSTPAIFWSRKTPEVWGIHVHAWEKTKVGGGLAIDDTYGEVWLDGKKLSRADLFAQMIAAARWVSDNPQDAKDAIELEDD